MKRHKDETEVKVYTHPINSDDVATELMKMGILPEYCISADIQLSIGEFIRIRAEYLVTGEPERIVSAFEEREENGNYGEDVASGREAGWGLKRKGTHVQSQLGWCCDLGGGYTCRRRCMD